MMIFLNNKYLVETVTNVSKAINKSEEFKDFGNHSSRCWSQMEKIRQSALCSICSGRSQIFFKSSKALISEATCLKTVYECKRFFFALNGLAQLLEESEASAAEDLTAEESDAAELQEALAAYRPPAALLAAFAEFERLRSTPAAVAVCEMVVNIRKPPYILVMNGRGLQRFEVLANRNNDLRIMAALKDLYSNLNDRKVMLEKLHSRGKLTDKIYRQKLMGIETLKNERKAFIEKQRQKMIEKTAAKAKKLADNWNSGQESRSLSSSTALQSTDNTFVSDSLVYLVDADRANNYVVDQCLRNTPMNMSLTFL